MSVAPIGLSAMAETKDDSTYQFRAIDRPTDAVATDILARVCANYQLGDDDVTDTTGALIDSGVVDLDWIIARGSMSPPSYQGGQIVLSVTKSHRFNDGDGALDVTVRADRDTHEIDSVSVGAFLY